MTLEKWQNTINNIKDKFEIIEEGKEHIEDQGGVDVEFIVFKGPLGEIRLEFVSRPAILDRKTIYSNRIGSDTKVDYVYSEDERSYQFNAYKKDLDTDEWVEIEAKMFE